MRVQLNQQCVIKANAQFWEQMLAMTLEPVPSGNEFEATAGHFFGSVGISGVWKGRIEVRLNGKLAHEATSAMTMLPVEDIGEAETLDATKEIANIIAGVIKSCLPRPCAMTVPEAAIEVERYASEPPAEDSIVVVFRHSAGELMVRVWEEEYQIAA